MIVIEDFKIKGEFITLSQFLKEISLIGSGGQAKWFLQDNEVLVNGQPETRRGRKLHVGDQLEVADLAYKFV